MARNHPDDDSWLGNRNNPFVLLFAAGFYADYTLSGKAALKGKIECDNGAFINVDIEIDFKFDVTQRLTERPGVAYHTARLTFLRGPLRAVNRAHLVSTLLTAKIKYDRLVDMIERVNELTSDLDRMYTLRDGENVTIRVAPSGQHQHSFAGLSATFLLT